MIEQWVSWVCSPAFLWAWMGLALGVFCVLFKVTAPYGRHGRSGWGPTVPARMAWVLMEAFTLVGIGLCWWVTVEPGRPAVVLGLLYGGHYLYRSFIYPVLSSSSATPAPLSVVLMALVFNVFNSTILGGWIFLMSPEGVMELSARWLGGGGLFVGGFVIHVRADAILRNLRRDHGPGYHIPKGFLYRWVSCPNYLGEVIQWVGFAILVDALAGWTFAVWTAANLVPRAFKHHRWYQARFADYPQDRRAIFPGIV